MSEFITRRQRERRQHIQYILDTAESIFAKKGFWGTTMKQIALKAEFALGTLYSYFRSKRGLYEKVIETKVDELIALVAEETANISSVQTQIEKFIYAKMSFFSNNLAFLRLYYTEVNIPRLDAEHILPIKLQKKYDSMLSNLSETIKQGINQGIFKPMNADVLAGTLDSLTNTFALSWLSSTKESYPVKTDIKTVTELFFHGAIVR